MRDRRKLIHALLPSLGQFADLGGIRRREILGLGAVGREVVQLPRLVLGGDELPVAHADGAVAFVSPPQVVVLHVFRRGRRPARGSCPVGAGTAFVGLAAARAPATSRIVGTMSITWPGSWRSSPRAAIPLGQWTISGVAMPPSWTQVLWRRNGVLATVDQPGPRQRCEAAEPGGRRRVVTVVADHDLRAGAVVGQEEDQRVLEGTHRAELVQHPADLAIHPVDHRGVNGHLRRLEFALLVGRACPTARVD